MEVGGSGVPAGESLRARGLKGSSEFLEPRTVSVPVSAIPQEGKVIDTSVPAPSSTGYSHARNRAMTSPAPGRTASPIEPSSPKGLHLGHFANPWESTRRRDTTSKLRRTLSAARSRRPRDVGGPYRESHIKKFRDQVMDAREGLSDDERVLLLVRENNECKADLREKKEQIKKLEVTVRSLRAQLARGATKVDNSFVKDENIMTDLNVNVNVNVARLVNENNDLEKRLREANAQIVIWKRDARVAHLTELKTELAVYKAEVARLSSLTHGGRVRHLRNDSAQSRLREVFGLAKEKDDIIQQLKEKLSENSASLGRSLENAMRVQSAADQLQEENEALCKELHILRKASIELTHTRGELGCTRADLKEARQRLEEFRRLMKDVGSPAEVFAVVRERDALLDMLKEQTLREEAQRLEFTRQQIDARKGMEDCIQEERSLANDKVVQLQQTCMMWNERHDRLALESAAERERFEKELQVLKELHEERHQELRLLLDRMESNPNFGKQSEVPQLQENMNLQIEEAPVATLKTGSQKQVLSTSSMSLTKSPFIESHCAKDFNADRKPSREANQEQNSQLVDTSRREETNSAFSTQNNNHVEESYRSSLIKYPHDLQTPAISTGEAQEGEPSTSPSKRFSHLSAMNSFIGTTGVKTFAINCDASDASVTTGNSVELTSLSNYKDNSLPKTGGVSIPAVVNDLGSMSRDSSTIRVHVPPPAARTSTTVDGGDSDSEKDLPIRVHVPPPPPAAVPAPPAARTSATVDGGDSDSEKDLPIRVHVPPPPPAAVPAPPAARTSATVDGGDSDSEKDLPIRVHVPPSPQHDGDGVENTYELVSPVPTSKLSSCSVGTSAHGDLRHRNRYEKEDVWGTASTCEEDESFNVHYVES